MKEEGPTMGEICPEMVKFAPKWSSTPHHSRARVQYVSSERDHGDGTSGAQRNVRRSATQQLGLRGLFRAQGLQRVFFLGLGVCGLGFTS